MPRRLLPLLVIPFVLAGCDQLGLEPASVTAARVEADGKAVGAACRHGGRAIEDCFTLNKRVDKAAIYAGWREMDDYMRENKLEPVPPVLKPEVKSAKAEDSAEESVAKADAKPEGKSDSKADAKERAGKKVAAAH
ncbi:MAG TPA: hypothetical protein VIP05_32495 [Burkholderiaceae bacterium]